MKNPRRPSGNNYLVSCTCGAIMAVPTAKAARAQAKLFLNQCPAYAKYVVIFKAWKIEKGPL